MQAERDRSAAAMSMAEAKRREHEQRHEQLQLEVDGYIAGKLLDEEEARFRETLKYVAL